MYGPDACTSSCTGHDNWDNGRKIPRASHFLDKISNWFIITWAPSEYTDRRNQLKLVRKWSICDIFGQNTDLITTRHLLFEGTVLRSVSSTVLAWSGGIIDGIRPVALMIESILDRVCLKLVLEARSSLHYMDISAATYRILETGYLLTRLILRTRVLGSRRQHCRLSSKVHTW